MRSFRFVADTAVTIEYDGCISIDLKLMTRGRTVPEMYGLAPWQERRYMLDNLWLEIPLRRDLASSMPKTGLTGWLRRVSPR